jgi:NAD(P) transhydrogenase subunit beta
MASILIGPGVLLAQHATTTQAAMAAGVDARDFVINILYAVAAIFFVFGLKMLSSPRTARQGNMVAALGMFIAVVITLLDQAIIGYGTMIAGFIVGGAIGAIAAKRVPMTGMPEMVALFNGSGGIASAFVAAAEYWHVAPATLLMDTRISIGISILIGMVTFTGSVIAYAKLAGKWIPVPWAGKAPKTDREGNLKKDASGNAIMDWKSYIKMGNPLVFPMQHPVNLVIFIDRDRAVRRDGIRAGQLADDSADASLAAALGVLITMPIGGADMPVVVSLLNSYSGLAACAAGFVLQNKGLIISGSLVGASGLDPDEHHVQSDEPVADLERDGWRGLGKISSGSRWHQRSRARPSARCRRRGSRHGPRRRSQKVFVIPGYGMAVAQAQHTVAEMASTCWRRSVISTCALACTRWRVACRVI